MSESPSMIIGVVGAGAMGSGIAQVAASAGHSVVLADAEPSAVARAKAGIAKSLARDVEKGRMDAARAAQVNERIGDAGAIGDNAVAFAKCGMVIEAIAERLDVKQSLFRELETVVTSECILATNTSSLSVSAIAGPLAHAERVVGVHFFNPAALMPLVEIVPSIVTNPAVVQTARTLVAGWKKVTVIASDTPGFIVNRIARPFYGESLRQLEEGVADIATIDWAMKELGGFRMGPFELMDFIGNDINYAVTQSVFEGFFFDPRYRPAITQRRLVEAGLYGRKRGRGYYSYAEGAERPEPRQDTSLGQAILDRTLAMLINEAVDAVHLGVASPEDIELSMTRGVNYPRGLLAWGDEIGGATVLARIDALQAEFGEDRYRASPLLRKSVRNRRRLLQ